MFIDKIVNRIAYLYNVPKFKKYISGKGTVKLGRYDRVFLQENVQLSLLGDLTLNGNSFYGNGRSSILRMDDKSSIETYGNFTFMYGADIILFAGGQLILGDNSFINSDCKIRCHKKIFIGNDCAISHDFTIMDSDAHSLNGNRDSLPIHIGDHVWIGTRVTILKGVTVGNGAVIAAGSIVASDVPPCSLVGGVPAKVLKSDVVWSK